MPRSSCCGLLDCCALEHNGGILFQFCLRGTYHSVNFYHETERKREGEKLFHFFCLKFDYILKHLLEVLFWKLFLDIIILDFHFIVYIFLSIYLLISSSIYASINHLLSIYI